MHRPSMLLFGLALALGCKPEVAAETDTPSAVIDPSKLPEHLEPIVSAWNVGVDRIEKSALAGGRGGPPGGWRLTDAESAELASLKSSAQATIAAASGEDRPWLLVAYVHEFAWLGLDPPQADAVLEVAPTHPAWGANSTGLFYAMDNTSQPERFRAYVDAVGVEHDTSHMRAGLAYVELVEADRAREWDRARALYELLKSPDFERTDGAGRLSTRNLDPDRSLRAELFVPTLCAPAIAGPEVGSTVCIDQLVPHDQPTLIVGWATWCGPCRAELPKVVEVVRGTTLRVITINYDDDPELAREHLRELGVADWTVLQLTVAGRKQREFEGILDWEPLPYLALIDERGIIQHGPPWFDAAALAAAL